MKNVRWLCLFLLAGGSVLALPANEPILGISPLVFDFDVPLDGANPTPGTLTITNIKNGGSGKMDWQAVEVPDASNPPASWLSLSAATGPLLNPNGSAQVSVLIDVTGVPAGNYHTRIKVTSAAALNDPLYADVNLHVSSTPRIGVTPTALSFAAPQGGPNPGAKSLTVQNTGGGLLEWTATLTPSSSWLKLNRGSGSLGPSASDTLSVSVDVVTTGLLASPVGNPYQGSIRFDASDPLVPSKTVNVDLTVSELPSIGVSPATLTFDTPVGSNPSNKIITITNIGGGTLRWIASDNAPWLTLSPDPTKGNLGKGASANVTLIVNTFGLVEGSNPAQITVSDEFDATIARKYVDVTLNVNATPKIGLNPTTLEFAVSEGSGASSPAAVSVTNTGTGLLAWTLTGGAAWLKKSTVGGSLSLLQSEPLLLSVNPNGLAPAVYSTTVQIEDPKASNSPIILSIQMTVKPSSLPTTAPAGQCGLLGLELVAALLLLRTLKSRGGSACS